AATTVANFDDGETVVPLTGSFPFNGGTTSQLAVCSNGYVSVATGNGTGYTPAVATMLAAPKAGWWDWHDYNPTIVGSGQIKFEEVAGIAYVTWNGVWDFGGTTAANANTFQFQFDESSGAVHLVIQTMSALGNGRLVGYSPGGASLDPGNQDISVLLPSTIVLRAADQAPLTIGASARPVTGTGINMVTSNIPVGTALGPPVVGLTQISPGLHLTSLGSPGCSQSTSPASSVVFLPGGPPASVPFNIPNVPAYVGIHVFTQSATFTSGFNAFGLLSSNGLDLGIGNL